LRAETGDGFTTVWGATFGAAFWKKLNGSDFGGVFFSTTTSFCDDVNGVFEAKSDKVGDLRAGGTGTGFGATLGAGLGAADWKKLNGCDLGGVFFSTTTGSGRGAGFGAADWKKLNGCDLGWDFFSTIDFWISGTDFG
jgi:hypothetical protein